MAPSIRSSRDSWASRGRRLKLSQRGDPQKRPILIRIYGLIGSLIVTIALIVLLIILQKKLPDGSNSSFHIPLRRNLENVPAQQEHHEVVRWQESVLEAEKRSAQLEPRITLAPTFIPKPIFHLSLGCYSTKTSCITERFPDKLRKRYQEVTCRSTVVETPCSTSTSSSPILLPIESPIQFSHSPTITPTPTPMATCIRGISFDISCTTEPVILKAKRQGAATHCSLLRVGICTTTTSSAPTPTSSTSIPTPTPTCISGTSLEIACTTTYHNILRAKRQLEISCSTSTLGPCSTSSSSRTSTPSSVTAPPVSVSSNSCAATAVSCSTYRNVDAGYETSCATSYSSMAGCPSSLSSTSIIITSSSSSTSSASSTLSSMSSSSIMTASSSNSPSSASPTLSPTISSRIITISSASPTLSPTSSSSIITSSSSSSPSSASSTLSPTSSSSIITTSSSSSPSSASSTLQPTSSSASSSSATTPPSSSSLPSSPSSSSPSVVPTSLTGSSSSSSVASTLPSSVSYSSVPSSGSSIGVTLPVPTGSISPSGSSLALSISASISLSVIVTPVSGSSASPTSMPPVLVNITTSGSASSVLKSESLVSLLGGLVSIGPHSGSSIPPLSSSASLRPVTSLALVTLAPGSPASLPSASGSFSLSPSPIILEITSSSTSLTDASTPISPATSISPSTLSKVSSGSSVPSASVPAASLTTPSESSISAIGSASPGLLQSIDATGSLGPSGASGGGGGRPRPTDDPKTINAQPDIWPVTQTILGDYTPLVVARGFLMLLNVLYHQLETYEPIRQLLIPGGGSLVDSPVMMPIQFAIICAHIGTGFSAGATFFDTSYCNPGQTSDIKICPPRLSVNPWVINVIIITLIVQALTIVFVITQWWKKPSGFSADPTSIAGIAAFMGHPEVEQEFVLLPTEINAAGLKRRLRGKKFRLGQFATEGGDVKYGIMPVDNENEPAEKYGFFDMLKDWWGKLQGKYTFLHNWKKNRLLLDAFFVALLLTLLGLTINAVSRVNKTQVVFLSTTAASGTGWRISIAILGIIVSCYWKRLFRDAQTFAPYINLGRGSSNPDATILLKRHSIPFTAFLPLLWHRHYTPASVAFIGLIAELLVVALSGLPYRPGQQRGEFLFWGITSLTILTIMVVQLISISIWRRKLPYLPRAPESIAAVMSYVAGTSMSRDFNGLEQLKRRERDQAIRNLGKSYAYGWRKEEDGRVRWIVDEVPRSKDMALIDGASNFS